MLSEKKKSSDFDLLPQKNFSEYHNMRKVAQLGRIILTLVCIVLPLIHILFMTGILNNRYIRLVEKEIALSHKKYEYAKAQEAKKAIKELKFTPIQAEDIEDDQPQFKQKDTFVHRAKHMDANLRKNKWYDILAADEKYYNDTVTPRLNELRAVDLMGNNNDSSLVNENSSNMMVALEMMRQEKRAERKFEGDETLAGLDEAMIEVKMQKYKERHGRRVQERLEMFEKEMSGNVEESKTKWKPEKRLVTIYEEKDYASFFHDKNITVHGIMPLEDKPYMAKPDYLEWASENDRDLPMPLHWFDDKENDVLTHAK